MVPFAKAVCVSSDASRRRALRRALFAAGREVDFADDLAALLSRDPQSIRGSLIVLDGLSSDEVGAIRDGVASVNGVSIVALTRDLGQDVALELLSVCDHVLSEPTHGGEASEVATDMPRASCAPCAIDEDGVYVTSVKLSRGDLFGLEKYLSWGAAVQEAQVSSYDEKRAALTALSEYATQSGARRAIVSRVEAVADELLMNALYDAPAKTGVPRAMLHDKAKPGGGPVTPKPVLVRWGCDAQHLAISVRDSFGLLEKSAIVEHLARARLERGAPRSDATPGAGLGLYFVLGSVTRFVANIVPGQATEVIALFDLQASGRQLGAARSVSVFCEPPPARFAAASSPKVAQPR